MRARFSNFRRTCMVAGVLAIASIGSAGFWDASIKIDRPTNSPTLTVKYDGAYAALIELRVNGQSVSTRSLDEAANKGETNFTLTLSDLREGDNEIEIRLFDKTGKLLSTQKSTIATEVADKGPVYLMGVKQGQSVQGAVEVKVGFGREFKSTYVSFFVDNNFKRLSNYPPFDYVWDTSKEANGWHELEAWVVDETTTTFKSKKIRVFVNNPNGRTERQGLGAEYTPAGTNGKTTADNAAGVKDTQVSGSVASNVKLDPTAPKVGAVPPATPVKATTTTVKPNAAVKPVATKVLDRKPVDLDTAATGAKTRVDAAAGTKPVPVDGAIAMGNRHMTPTGTRVVSIQPLTTAGLIAVTRGQRLSGITTFNVLLNNRFVEFDVAPRVDGGVPMTPFRHLIEKAGGSVDWMNDDKSVAANAEGANVWFKVGDKNAKVNDSLVSLELAPYVDRGRTIVPLSFISDVLKVNIQFDPTTGHVLITNKK